nr:GNAT family N-acetyltransferase [Chloroflexaceae bacterium]
MLRGNHVTLRAISRADLPRLWQFNNDLEVELAGGGDPPIPQSLERLQADFEREAGQGGRNGANFVIETDGVVIGQCGLFNIDETGRTCELGIGIGDKAYWGRGYGRDALQLLLDYAFRLRNMRR